MIDLVRSFLRDSRPALVVLLVLACLFVADRASATGYDFGSNQYAAYQQCQAHAAGNSQSCTGPHSDGGGTYYQLIFDGGGYNIYAFTGGVTTCTPPQVLQSGDVCGQTLPTAAECAAKAPYELNGSLPEGAIQCDIIAQCAFEAVSDPASGNSLMDPYQAAPGVGVPCNPHDGGVLTWNCPTGWVQIDGLDAGGIGHSYCLPPDGDSDGDGIPNDDDGAPEQVGDTPRDSDEDGIPDNKDSAPNDPDNGEGEDGESDNTSTGGADCTNAPVSKGDGIAAQVAYQTWKTRCAVERLTNITITQGSSAGGLSAGDSTKLTAVKTATEATAGATGATASGVAAINGKLGTETSGDLDGRGGDGMAGDGEGAGVTEDREFGADGLDDEGYGFARSCPAPPSFEYNGQTITIPTEKFCEWMELGSILVLILAAFASLRIMGTA